MISDANDLDADIRHAIADAAGTLISGDPRAHVFYEERVDVRMTLASSGLRDVVTTRTRGAAISGRDSLHHTDPHPLELGAAARKPGGFDQLSIEDLETVILESGSAASVGRRHPFWSAKLVGFHQTVWVGTREGGVVRDVRRGRRVEMRVRVGTAAPANAVGDLVLPPEPSQSLRDCFSRVFDRAEERVASIVTMPRGTTPAVFAPGVAGIVVHELVGHALEGDVVARHPTWIQADGLPAPGRPLTVVDDPRRGRGAWAIDDEGTGTGETVLVEGGRPVGMLLDRPSASFLGKVSTGHGRRSSYLEPVRPRMGCTFLAPGIDAPEEVLRSTPSGVYIRRLAAGHTDPLTGRATCIVSDADRIIDGRLAEPLDEFVIELSGVELWTSIDRVAHDLVFDTCVGSCVRDGQPVAVSVGAPTIRIGLVTVRS